MSATGTGLTQISNVNLAAGGAAGSQLNFTHNLGVRAVQVYCSDAVTGRQLDGTEISVAQPTANVVEVANITTGAVVVNVSIRWQYDSVEENLVASTDSRIAAAVGPAPVAGGIVGGGAANQVTYWTGAAAIAGNALLTTDPATGDLDRIKNVPYDWPAANAVGVLTNDGAGNLSWAAGGAGANTALSNLAAVAVNANMDPGADDSLDLGNAGFRWRELWVGVINAPNLTLNATQAAGIFAINANGQFIATVANDIQLTPAATYNVAIGLDGTAALPSLAFGTVADPNTGIFHPAVDTLAISTAGAERSRWSDNGDVTLAGGLGANRVLWDETNAIFQVGGTAYNVGPATTYSATNIGAVDGAGNPTTLYVSGAPLSLQSGSYVEVVTGALLATFTADNAVQLQPGDAAAVSAAGTGRFRYNSVSNTLQFSNNGAAYQTIMGATASLVAGRVTLSAGATTITDNANLTFNGTVLAVNQDGTVALPSITLGTAADPDTGIFHPAADELAITSGGSERLRTRLTAAGLNQGRVEINGGTLLSSGENAFVVNSVLASTVGGYSIGAAFEATSFAGAADGEQYAVSGALRFNAGGYTGTGKSYGGFFYNANSGKAGDATADWFNIKGIIGVAGFSVPDATAVNPSSMGVVGVATGSVNRNFGVIGRATGVANTNVAVSGYATGGTQGNVGALFAAEYTNPLLLTGFGSAAVVAVSESGTIPLFVGATGFSPISRVFQVEGSGTTRVGLDGSVGAPALTFGTIGTDPNTGIWHPAADTLAFSNNGVETMRLSSTNSVGIGVTAPTAQLHISGVPGTSNYHMYWIAALGATNAQVDGIRYELTSAGTAGAASRIGMQLLLSGTATGGGGTTFMYGTAIDLGLACDSNNLRLSSTAVAPLGNVGTVAYAYGTSTGLNIGNFAEAVNGGLNIGMLAKSTTAKNSASNVGVLAVALNTGSSPVQVAGYFGLVSATPTLTSAALIADNGTTTSNIFEARDNGTAVVTVADAGAVTMTGTVLMSGVVTMSNSAVVSGRLNGASAAVVAANDLTLGATNLNLVSGNTQINALTIAGWSAGAQVTLIFSGTPTVKHNTAGGAGTAVMLLAGSVDLVAAANTVLTLMYDGTSWQETSRKVA